MIILPKADQVQKEQIRILQDKIETLIEESKTSSFVTYTAISLVLVSMELCQLGLERKQLFAFLDKSMDLEFILIEKERTKCE